VKGLIRQLLKALHHLREKGVEHRDVKPENLLLFAVSVDDKTVPFLKLADFGWATVAAQPEMLPPVPPEGVGSLWYAPPELNPPLKGTDTAQHEMQLGKSDMWSVGIITYLLLTGHSPFNTALRVKDATAREREVIRLAALGEVNMNTKAWMVSLSTEAKSFIMSLIQPVPVKRLSALEALGHPFMMETERRLQNPVPEPMEESSKWLRLDGLQQLCWLAVARAASEPELIPEAPSLKVFIREQGSDCANYLESLARKLVLAASPKWFEPQAAWSDVLRLAFLYVDLDSDGYITVSDLSKHLAGESRARELSDAWIYKWRNRKYEALPIGATHSLNMEDFQVALCTGVIDTTAVPVAPPAGTTNSEPDDFMALRMGAIEEVYDRFIDDESMMLENGV